MVELGKEERQFLKGLVKQELKRFEKHEQDFEKLMVNSPVLSQLHMQDTDIPFMATEERYHQFLKDLVKKL